MLSLTCALLPCSVCYSPVWSEPITGAVSGAYCGQFQKDFKTLQVNASFSVWILSNWRMSVDVIQAGIVFVKYTGDVPQLKSFRLLSNKSGEWKGRLIELAMSGAVCSLHVYKLKPGNKRVPFFEIQITARTILTTSNQDYQYHFAFDNEPQALFYVTDESVRSEWFRVISNCILKLRVLEAQTDRYVDRTPIPFTPEDIPDDVSEESVDILSANASFSAGATPHSPAAPTSASAAALPSPSILKFAGASAGGNSHSANSSAASLRAGVTFSLPEHLSKPRPPENVPITAAPPSFPAAAPSVATTSYLSSSTADVSRSLTLNRGKSSSVGEPEPVRRSLKAFDLLYDSEQTQQPASLFLNRSEFDDRSKLHISELLSPIGVNGNNLSSHSSPSAAAGSTAAHRYIPVTLSSDNGVELKPGGGSPVMESSKRMNSTASFGPGVPALSSQLRAASTSASASLYASNTPYSDLRRSQTTGSSVAAAPHSTLTSAPATSLGVAGGFGPAGDHHSKPVTSVLSAQQNQAHSSLLVQLETLKSQVNSLTAMNDELNEALEVSEENRRNERENYAKQITQLHVSLRESENARNQHCDHVKELQSELEASQELVETTLEDVAVAKDIQRTQSNLLSEYLDKIAALTEVVEAYKQQDTQRAGLSEIMAAVKSEVTDLKSVLSVRDMEVAKWKFECEAAVASLKASDAEIAARDKLIKEVLAAKEDLLITKDATQLELNAANHRYNELLAQLDQQSNHQLKESELRDTVITLERDVLRSQVELNAYRVSEESYKLSTVRLESLIKEQQAFIDDMSKQLITAGELKKINAELLGQLNDARLEQVQQSAEQEKLQKLLAETKSKLAQSEEAGVAAKSEWEAANATLQGEISNLNARLKQASVDESVLVSLVIVVWLLSFDCILYFFRMLRLLCCSVTSKPTKSSTCSWSLNFMTCNVTTSWKIRASTSRRTHCRRQWKQPTSL